MSGRQQPKKIRRCYHFLAMHGKNEVKIILNLNVKHQAINLVLYIMMKFEFFWIFNYTHVMKVKQETMVICYKTPTQKHVCVCKHFNVKTSHIYIFFVFFVLVFVLSADMSIVIPWIYLSATVNYLMVLNKNFLFQILN